MNIIEVPENKKQYLDLLLLADEQESMIDRYLERGTMYALDDNGVRAVCVVTDEGDGILEIKNIATAPEHQGRGYAKALVCFIARRYGEAFEKIEFSACSWEHGWNIKFKKAGKTLCTIYPRENHVTVLVVVGSKEKEAVEAMLPGCTAALQELYHRTQEGNGQRWLMIDLEDRDSVYDDLLRMIGIRRNPAGGGQNHTEGK